MKWFNRIAQGFSPGVGFLNGEIMLRRSNIFIDSPFTNERQLRRSDILRRVASYEIFKHSRTCLEPNVADADKMSLLRSCTQFLDPGAIKMSLLRSLFLVKETAKPRAKGSSSKKGSPDLHDNE